MYFSRICLLSIILITVCLVSPASSEGNFTIDSSDVYQQWGLALRAFYSASPSNSRLVISCNKVDLIGNIYASGSVVGTFQDRTTLGPNSRDVVVMKLNAQGGLLWLRYLASYSDDNADGCELDAAGNFFVVGSTTGSLNGQANYGNWDGFIAKFSSLGELVWVTQSGTSNNDYLYGVAVDPSGNPVAVGLSYALWGPRHFGSIDVYIAKYNANNGSAIWTQQIGSSGDDYPGEVLGNSYVSFVNPANTVAVSNVGDVYVGYSSNVVPTSSGLTARGLLDVYIAKLSGSTGSVQWYQQIASTSNEWITSVVALPDGNIAISGRTQGSIANNLYAGSWDAFVAKISSQAQIIWVKQFGNAAEQEITNMDVDLDGNLYAVGFTNPPVFDDEVDITQRYDYYYTVAANFLTKFDPFGNRIYTRFYRGSRSPRSSYYTSVTTYSTSVSVVTQPNSPAASSIVISGIYNGLFQSADDVSYGDVASYYAGFVMSIAQNTTCTLNDFNSVLTEINDLFYSLNIQ